MKIKVLHVQVLPKMTGVQQVSYDILKGLSDELYEKHIVFGSPDFASNLAGGFENNIIEKFESIGVKVHFFRYLKREVSFDDFNLLFEMYDFLKEHKFDVVHTNSTKPGVVGRIAARLSGVKSIFHTVHGISFHQYIPWSKRAFYYLLEIFSCLFGDVNICVNKFYKKYYPDRMLKTITIYNGVDFSKFQVNRTKSDFIRVGFFARLDEQKNPLFYLEVIKRFVDVFPECSNVKFYLAGDGELRDDCLKYISEQLSDEVIYVGWVEDVNEFLNSLDILIQPSKWEAFGLSIVEANYFGVPCIGSNVEGIPEVIENGTNGFVCDLNDIDSFVLALGSLASNGGLLNEMSGSSRNHVEVHFSYEQMIHSYKSLYSDLPYRSGE